MACTPTRQSTTAAAAAGGDDDVEVGVDVMAVARSSRCLMAVGRIVDAPCRGSARVMAKIANAKLAERLKIKTEASVEAAPILAKVYLAGGSVGVGKGVYLWV